MAFSAADALAATADLNTAAAVAAAVAQEAAAAAAAPGDRTWDTAATEVELSQAVSAFWSSPAPLGTTTVAAAAAEGFGWDPNLAAESMAALAATFATPPHHHQQQQQQCHFLSQATPPSLTPNAQ